MGVNLKMNIGFFIITPCQIVLISSLILLLGIVIFYYMVYDDTTIKIIKERIIKSLMIILSIIVIFNFIYPEMYSLFGGYKYVKVGCSKIHPMYDDIYLIGNSEIKTNNNFITFNHISKINDSYQKIITLKNVNYSIITNGNNEYKVEKYVTKPESSFNEWFLGYEYYSKEKYVFYLEDIDQTNITTKIDKNKILN